MSITEEDRRLYLDAIHAELDSPLLSSEERADATKRMRELLARPVVRARRRR